MGFLFMESWGHYLTTNELSSTTAGNITRGKYASVGSWSTSSQRSIPAIADLGGGRKEFHVREGSTLSQTLALNFATNTWTGQTTIHVGFRFTRRTSATGPIELIRFLDGGDLLGTLGVNSDWELTYWRGSRTGTEVLTAPNAFVSGNAVYVEASITFDNSTGAVEFYFNESSVASTSGVDTINAGTSCDRATWFTHSPNGRFWAVSDEYIHDTAVQGILQIITRLPVADGDENEMAPSTGTDHYAMVDEVSGDGDGTHLSTSTVGHREQFDYASMPSDAEVLAVQVLARAIKDSGTIQLKLVQDDLTNEDLSAGKDIAVDYGYVLEIFDLHPDGSAWDTPARVDAVEFGAELA